MRQPELTMVVTARSLERNIGNKSQDAEENVFVKNTQHRRRRRSVADGVI